MQVQFTTIFDSFVNSEFSFDYMDDMTLSLNGKSYLTITDEHLDDVARKNITQFLTLIGIKEDNYPNNWGTYTFDGLRPERGCLGYIGLEKLDPGQDPKVVLKIGNDIGQGNQALNLEITIDEVTVKTGSKKTTKKIYTINDVEVELHKVYERQTKPGEEPKLVANYAKLTDTDNDTEYIIPFLVDKNVCESPYDFIEYFKTQTLENVLKHFGTSGGRIWSEANKLFRGLFSPKGENASNKGWNSEQYRNGILLLVKNAKSKFIPKGSFDGAFDSDYYSCEWEIIATSHPDALVRIYNKNQFEVVRLEDVNNINFPSSAVKTNEGYHGVVGKRINASNDIYQGIGLIYFSQPNPTNPDWIPYNELVLIDYDKPKSIKRATEYYIKRVLKGSPDIQNHLNEVLQRSLNEISANNLIVEVSEDDAIASLHSDKNWMMAPCNQNDNDDDDIDVTESDIIAF